MNGGSDSGAIGINGLKEKSANLKIAMSIKKILEGYGIDVTMTRTDDNYVSLDKRVEIANKSNADYFISIHINSAENIATGTETYAYSPNSEGNKLANSIQSNLVNLIKLPDRGVKYNSLKVVRETIMPAALVEVAFINNPNEEELLRDDNFIHKVATGISKGILQHAGMNYEEENSGISDWAKEAMEWAMDKERRLTDGSSPKEPITLERLITILHRYNNLTK